MKRLKNSKGTIWYGLHMYPGVAEYANDGKPYRVLLNEKTIKSMDKSFAGRPVYLQHTDEVEQNVDKLRNEADGWVMRSFYNAPDGKHWCQFITVTKRAERAISQGYRLSNCITDMQMNEGGECNGVSYDNEVVGGEYEHLAIVSNPRYEQSVIFTPEQFQKYNDEKLAEIKRLSNAKEPKSMKLTFFTKKKIENSKSEIDFENMSVMLPKSNVEKTLLQLVNDADAAIEEKGKPAKVDMSAMVSVGGVEMSISDLIAKHNDMCAKIDALEDLADDEEESDEDLENSADDDDDLENAADDDDLENAADDDDEEETPPPKKKVKNSPPPVETPKKKVANSKTPEEIQAAKKKADKLKNASHRTMDNQETAKVILSIDQIQRGKSLYGRD